MGPYDRVAVQICLRRYTYSIRARRNCTRNHADRHTVKWKWRWGIPLGHLKGLSVEFSNKPRSCTVNKDSRVEVPFDRRIFSWKLILSIPRMRGRVTLTIPVFAQANSPFPEAISFFDNRVFIEEDSRYPKDARVTIHPGNPWELIPYFISWLDRQSPPSPISGDLGRNPSHQSSTC